MKSKATVISVSSILAVILLALAATVPVRALAPTVNNQTLTIVENSPNGATTSPSKIAAFDPEGEPLTYDVTGGTGTTAFDVDFNTGIVTVANSLELDYEVTQSFTLNVTVQDTIAPMEGDDGVITIQITDAPDQDPTLNDQTFDVNENSPAGTNVGTLVYDDPDTNDSHTFDITGGSGDGLFSIDSIGKITVAPGAQLNYEAVTSYNMTVEIEDEGGNTDTALITIDINPLNENPILNDQSFGVSEAAANGAVVGTVAATDPESGALTFSLTGTTAFAINPTTGQITVSDNSQIDFETDPSLTFTAKAQDTGGLSDTGTITVNLTEENDPPKTTGIPDQVVNEGAPPREIILWGYFSDDEDTDPQLSFVVQNEDDPDNVITNTDIDNATGKLTLTFAASGGGVANITIRAFDTEGAHVDDTFKVDSNDAPTAPPIQNVTVNEDAGNSLVDLYDVFDDAEQADADLTYEVVSVSNGGLFAVPPAISKPNLVLDYAQDVNGKSDVVVKATDGGGLSAQTTFKVTVNALNDPPTTNGIDDVNVSEDAPDRVIDLGDAFDDKEDDDNELDYTVTANTNAGLFTAVTVNDAAATLTLDFKANTSGSATLTVRAEDKGGQDVSTQFVVTVGSDNDAPTLDNFGLTIEEDDPVNFTTNFFASLFNDADNDSLATVRIVSLPGDGALKVGGAGGTDVAVNQEIPAAQLGTLWFIPALNWDSGSTSFQWNGSDGSSYAAAPATVTFTVQAKNDAPTITNFDKFGEESTNVIFAAQDFQNAFADVDGDSLVKVQITSLPQHGTLKRGNTNIVLNEQLDLAGLNQLRFLPDGDWSGETTFNWKASDGKDYSTAATATIIVNPINDAPTIDLNGGSAGVEFNAIFVAGGPAVAIAGNNLAITDIDNTTMEEATVIIINRKNGAKETLSADPTGTDIEVSYSPSSGVLFLTGPDTIANFEKVLRTVTFRIEPDVANPDPTTRNISFRVNDGSANSNDAVSHVEIIHPRIEITVEQEIQTVIKGGTAVFTIHVKNTGDVDLNNIVVTSAAVPDCNKNPGNDPAFAHLEAGESLPTFACIASNVTQRIDNKLVVKATDAEAGTQVTDDVTAVVRVLQDIIVTILPDPTVGNTIVKGQNAVFNVIVENPSESKLKDVAVTATIDYDLSVQSDGPAVEEPAPACNAVIGDLNAKTEKGYTCTIPNVQASFKIEVVAVGMIEGVAPTESFDITEIGVLDMSVEAFSDPFQILAGQPTTVEFSVDLTNISSVPLLLQSLQSSAHGNLLNAANNQVSANTCPGLNLSLQPDEVRSCSYEVTMVLEPPAFTNTITAIAGDNQGHQMTIVDEAIVSVADFSPLEVVLSADPPSLVAPGGAVNLIVQVTNNTSSDVTLDALNDSVLGNVDGLGTCELPHVINGNGSYSCSYPVAVTGKTPGQNVTFTINALADAEQVSDSVVVPITATPQVRVYLSALAKLSVAGEPNNGVCDALPIAVNRVYYFMPDDADDWYRFSVNDLSSGKVKLSSYVADGQIILYSGNCSSPTLVGNNGNYEPAKEIAVSELQEGTTYYIRILTDSGFSSATPYSLAVEVAAR